eukprot:g389.t1
MGGIPSQQKYNSDIDAEEKKKDQASIENLFRKFTSLSFLDFMQLSDNDKELDMVIEHLRKINSPQLQTFVRKCDRIAKLGDTKLTSNGSWQRALVKVNSLRSFEAKVTTDESEVEQATLVAEQALAARILFAKEKLNKEAQEDSIKLAKKNFKKASEKKNSTKDIVAVAMQTYANANNKLHESRLRATRMEASWHKLKEKARVKALPLSQALETQYQACLETLSFQDINEKAKLIIDAYCENIKVPKQDNKSNYEVNSSEYLQHIREEASVMLKAFAKLFGKDGTCCRYPDSGELIPGTRICIPNSIKGIKRSCEKVYQDYHGNFSRLVDIARAMIVCENNHSVIDVLEMVRVFAERKDVVIMRVKNRFATPKIGFAPKDILLSITIPNGSFPTHIMEIQIHLQDILKIKNSGGHKLYDLVRTLGLGEEITNSSNDSSGRTKQQPSVSCVDTDIEGAGFQFFLREVEEGRVTKINEKHVKDIDALYKIAEVLKSSTCMVQSIDLLNSHFRLDDESSLIISHILSLTPCSVQCFRFDGSNMTHYGIERIGNAVVSNNVLKKIYVANADLPVQILRGKNEKFATALHTLQGQLLGSIDCIFISALLPGNVSLTELSLRENFIYDDGIIALAKALTSNTSLKKIFLGGNKFGISGCIALAKMLKKNDALQFLEVSRVAIGDKGACLLIDGLKDNNSLTHLQMNSCGIGYQTCKALHLRKHQLNHLELRSNNIDDSAASELASLLKENADMNLSLENNPFNENGGSRIGEQVAKGNGNVHVDFRQLQQLVTPSKSLQVEINDSMTSLTLISSTPQKRQHVQKEKKMEICKDVFLMRY